MSEYVVRMPNNMPYEIKAELNAWYVEDGPIVRCRDCKFYILDEFDEAECHQFTDYYDQPVHWPKPNGFCAWGERKENSNEEGNQR